MKTLVIFYSFSGQTKQLAEELVQKTGTIIPFCTHGGGGFGDIKERMAKECPTAKVREPV